MPKSFFLPRCSVLALALALFAGPVRGTGPSFSSASFPTGTTPVYIAVADFNGDGRQDIAVANQGSSNVTVLLAKAGGGYNSSTVAVTGGITSIVAADLNGDGKIDLAIGNPNASGNISYLMNDGVGNFTLTPMSPVLNAAPKFVVTPDLNGDGYADVVWSDGSAGMYRAGSTTTSGGLFAGFSQFGSAGYSIVPSSPTVYPGTPASGFMAVGDVENKGRLDVVVVTNKNDIITVDGNGQGALIASWWSALPAGTQSKFVALADVNNDGKLDAIVTCNDGNVYVMLGNGTGSFALQGIGVAFGGASASGAAAGDFNGDGYLDLAVASADGHLYILLGNGMGSFVTPAALVLPLGTSGSVGAIVAKDVNGDGKIDLVATDKTNGQVYVFLNNLPSIVAPALLSFHSVTGGAAPASQTAALSFTSGTAPGFSVASNSPWLSAVANLASPPTSLNIQVDPAKVTFGAYSGTLTLTAGGYFGTTIQVNLNVVTPDGTLVAGSPLNFGSLPTALAIADMNHDGIPDLVVEAGSNVYSMKNDGSGKFTNKSNVGVSRNMAGLTIADFNGDGNPDVATAAPDFSSSLTQVFVLLGDGNSGLGNAAALVGQGGFSPTAIVSGDFNGDGEIDIAVLNSVKVVGSDNTSTLLVLLGGGGASFTPLSGVPRDLSGAKGAAMLIGDFNRDGKLDLAIVHQQASASNTTQGALTILLGNGDGTFTEAAGSPYLTGNTSTSLAMGDFNNDGFSDLAVGAQADSTHSITVFLGDGAGNFASSSFAVSGQVQGLTASDFDGDGNVDLAAVNVTGNADLILLGNGTGGFAAPVSIAGSVTSGAAGFAVAGDFTSDGTTDLVSTGSFSQQLNFFMGSKAPTSTTLTSPLSSRLVVGETITFTASTVAPAAWAKPGGTVTFVDGANTYPAGTVNSAGQASTGIALTLGSHSFYASYSGDNRTSASDSSGLPVTFTSYTPTLSFSTTPSGSKVGTKLTSFTVSVIDPQTFSPAPKYNAAITLTLNSGSFDGTSTTVVTAVAGVATFNNLIVDAPGSYTITAATTGATSATGSSFTVGSNPATHFSVTGFPNPAAAGTSGSFMATALDALGFTAATYRGAVKFTSSDSLAVLPANYTFTASDNGVHTFQATMNTAGESQSITVTDVNTAAIAGSQIGIATQSGTVPAVIVSFAGTPQAAAPGTPFPIALAAKVTDAGHNGIVGVTVNFAAPNSGASAVLSSPTAVTDASGVATVNATANNVSGSYNVIATVNSQTATFALINTNKCDLNIDGVTTAADVQLMINQGLGLSGPASDLNGDHVVTVVDMQIVSNAVLSLGCSAS